MMVKANSSVVKNGEEEDLERRRRGSLNHMRDSYLKAAVDGLDRNDR
jgi:hypothetical protein